MSFATYADLVALCRGEQELIDLTDTIGAGVPDLDVVNAALARAGAIVDSALAGRYALPLDLSADPSAALVLSGIQCDEARFILWSDRASVEVLYRHEEAVKDLDRFASGRRTISLAGLPAPAESAGPAFSSTASLFSDRTLGGY